MAQIIVFPGSFKFAPMADEAPQDKARKARPVRLSEEIWRELDKDAERCKRSSNAQIEALLEVLYFDANVNIPARSIDKMASVSAIQRRDKKRA